MTYAADTSTSAEKTRAELETIIRKFGADAFAYAMDGARAMIQFRAKGKQVRFVLPLPSPNEKRFTHQERCTWQPRTEDASRKLWEQACRSSWRALFLVVKAKLVAVESRIVSFDSEFMAYIVLPNGRTAGEEILPMIEDAYATGRMPSFAPALEDRKP